MNTLTTGLTSAIFSVTLLYGDNSINEQIQAMQNVSVQERAELMNKLKIQIASMNEEQRADAITALRIEMGGKAIPSAVSPATQRMQQMQSSQQQGTIMQRAGDRVNTQFPRMRR
ncbi:MAG TPA: hypothetical protein PLM93_05885 [Sulfuricurvum sp.]|nr:MAG: hypothetical protein B7Y30_07905 [Campylobacterales bacterium 16-40-21]OZA02758.1 MAG: hypothetical protein B7X89_08215 [Sulfuricurvum sp. 17-40-25]HQS66699.1 hypothetical protein [Sulfuricurvum sp.]HQT37368.1 hypothetical protein [Sulfuricurvum sp.]